MLDNKDDKNIDWDKLAEHYDGEQPVSGLSEEEMRELAAIRFMKAQLAQRNVPVDERWQQFDAARRKPRIVQLLKYAAAAVIVLAIGAGIWMMRPGKQGAGEQGQLANAAPQGKVQLKMGDGRTVELGLDSQTIRHGSHAQVHADTAALTYAAGDATAAAGKMDELYVPRGLQYRLQLADGSRVWLNADTKLRFPAVFSGDSREVYVEGEAFFEVKADAARPFVVHTGSNHLKVLGTSFNVNTFDQAVTTTLTTGRLLVSAGAEKETVSPDEQTIYKSGKLKKRNVDTQVFTAWKDGDLYFEDAPLADICRYLERSYDYQFEFEHTSLKTLRFTLDLRRPAHLQDALDLIRISLENISFHVQGRTVRVSRQSDK